MFFTFIRPKLPVIMQNGQKRLRSSNGNIIIKHLKKSIKLLQLYDLFSPTWCLLLFLMHYITYDSAHTKLVRQYKKTKTINVQEYSIKYFPQYKHINFYTNIQFSIAYTKLLISMTQTNLLKTLGLGYLKYFSVSFFLNSLMIVFYLKKKCVLT